MYHKDALDAYKEYLDTQKEKVEELLTEADFDLDDEITKENAKKIIELVKEA